MDKLRVKARWNQVVAVSMLCIDVFTVRSTGYRHYRIHGVLLNEIFSSLEPE